MTQATARKREDGDWLRTNANAIVKALQWAIYAVFASAAPLAFLSMQGLPLVVVGVAPFAAAAAGAALGFHLGAKGE